LKLQTVNLGVNNALSFNNIVPHVDGTIYVYFNNDKSSCL